MRRSLGWLLLLALLPAGCFSPHKAARRSAIEQQVTSAAIQVATQRLDLSQLDPKRPYRIEATGMGETDKDWARTCLQRRLADAGYTVVAAVTSTSSARRPEPGASDRIELVLAFAGADVEHTVLGFPLTVPGVPLPSFSISLFDIGTITGRARVGALVWRRGRLIRTVPEVEASRFYQNLTFLTFFGPFSRTDLEELPPPPPGPRR